MFKKKIDDEFVYDKALVPLEIGEFLVTELRSSNSIMDFLKETNDLRDGHYYYGETGELEIEEGLVEIDSDYYEGSYPFKVNVGNFRVYLNAWLNFLSLHRK